MPKFDLWSDLHIDSTDQPSARWQPESEILVIPGDISDDMIQANQFVDVVAKSYKTVIYCRGNHEHFIHKPYLDVVDNVGPTSENVVFLTYQRPYYFHTNEDGSRTLFLGLTGWYDFNFPGIGLCKEEQKLNAPNITPDIEYINFSYSDGEKIEIEDLADKHARMLRAQVSAANFLIDEKVLGGATEIVILTHTVPHIKGVVGPSHPWASGNGCFYNSKMQTVWEEDTNKLISTWCFGHTHNPCDFTDHGIRFVCNPRGRWREQKERGRLSVPVVIDSKAVNEYK